jgi:hypothetical protein
MATRHGHAVFAQYLLALVLVDVHWRLLFSGAEFGPAAFGPVEIAAPDGADFQFALLVLFFFLLDHLGQEFAS